MATAVLEVVCMCLLLASPGLARPQALRVSAELGEADQRWPEETDDHDRWAEIARSFRQSAGVQHAVVEVLRGLPEEELLLLERTLVPEEELPQADMPVEDLVEDIPQELRGEEVADDAAYRGELLVLDNVNSSSPLPIPFTLNNTQEEPLFPQLQKINRENILNISLERLKEMRLETIKNQIMNILWPEGTPPTMRGNVSSAQAQPPLLRAIADKMRGQTNPFTRGDVYTEKIQSFYPSCDVPRNTDTELWNDSQTMNLLFDLVYPSLLQGTQVNIVAAKLRLYKLSQSNSTVSSENCPPEPAAHSYPGFVEDKMIRVSIYWYTRSLKKHRVKRKLLDSQMLSVHGELWTEWNIRSAVKAWRDNGRNFGLAVQVEDEDGALLPASTYFSPMNCSQEASTSRPIPGFLVARALAGSTAGAVNNTNHTFGQALPFDTLLFPMIDICTVEFPESEKPDAVYYHKVTDINEPDNNKPLRTPVAKKEPTVQPVSTNSNGEKHRVRHQNHRHGGNNNNDINSAPTPHKHLETIRRDDGDSIEEITWAEDLDGHQLRKQIIVQKVIMKPQNDNNQEESER